LQSLGCAVGSKVNDACGLHSNSTKASELVVKYDDLDRQLQLLKREQIAHEHRETRHPDNAIT